MISIKVKEFFVAISLKDKKPVLIKGMTQFDNCNKLNIQIRDGSKMFDFTGATNIVVTIKKPDGTFYIDSIGTNVVIINAETGELSIELQTQACINAGSHRMLIEFYNGTDRFATSTIDYYVDYNLNADSNPAVESATELPVLQNLVSDLTALETNVETAEALRVTAENNRDSAEDARVNAETLRVTAENTRNTAELLRETSEALRISAESTRASNELNRQTVEARRNSYTAYEVGKTYNAGEKVSLNGSSYYCKYNNVTSSPPSIDWLLIASKGDKGDKGDKGQSGIYVPVDANNYCFEVVNGDLMVNYADGSDAPDYSINGNGELILNI